MDQSKIGSKKWINELIYGKYRDASDDEDDDLEEGEYDDEAAASTGNSSSGSSSTSLLNNDDEDDDEDEGFQRVSANEENTTKPTKQSQRVKETRSKGKSKSKCETNTQDECFIIAINPAQKYFVLFDVNSYSDEGKSSSPLGLSQESYSSDSETTIMQSLANWLDKITEGLSPNKHAIRDWPVFN